MSEQKKKEGLLGSIFESVLQGKLSPEDVVVFLSKMNLEKKGILAILESLSAKKITVSQAKEEIASLLEQSKRTKRKRPV